MRDSLYDNAKRAVNEYPRGREATIRRDKWLWDYPAQVTLQDISIQQQLPHISRSRGNCPGHGTTVLTVSVLQHDDY